MLRGLLVCLRVMTRTSLVASSNCSAISRASAVGRDDARERAEAEDPAVERAIEADVERQRHAARVASSRSCCDGCHSRART